MTTSSGRSAETRRSSRSVGQWLLGLLIVLALAASVIMVFTDDLSMLGSLAVIAALWAAVIGAIMVTKFRRQAESAEAKSRDLRLVYELQLEREIAARRQYELDVETTIRKEVAAESNEELAGLKEQVLALRASLEMLLGESLPDQRTALPNEKLRALASGFGAEYPGGYRGGFEAGTGFAAATGFSDDDAVAARDFAATAPSAGDGRHIESVDPNEMTEIIPIVTDEPLSGRIATEVPLEPEVENAYSAEPAFGEQVSDVEIVAEEVEVSVPDQPAFAEQPVFTDETPTDEWASEAGEVAEVVTESAPEPTAQVTPEQFTPEQVNTEPAAPESTAPESAAPESIGVIDDALSGRHEGGADSLPASAFGRRRRAAEDDDSAHSNGLPVSELLAQLRQADAAGGRRRRREG